MPQSFLRGSVIQATGMAEFRDNIKMGNGFKARNSFRGSVNTIPEKNASIDSRGG